MFRQWQSALLRTGRSCKRNSESCRRRQSYRMAGWTVDVMKVPYAMVAAVDNFTRHAQMAAAMKYNFPRLRQEPFDDTKILTLACYGPSLKDTWQTMKPPIMSMSGATQWLAERGVIADYHVAMDPRADQ